MAHPIRRCGTNLEDLDFADDICFICSDQTRYEYKTAATCLAQKQVGLKVYVAKAKPIVRAVLPELVSIDGEFIEEGESL